MLGFPMTVKMKALPKPTSSRRLPKSRLLGFDSNVSRRQVRL
jgi:hypothetical protein